MCEIRRSSGIIDHHGITVDASVVGAHGVSATIHLMHKARKFALDPDD